MPSSASVSAQSKQTISLPQGESSKLLPTQAPCIGCLHIGQMWLNEWWRASTWHFLEHLGIVVVTLALILLGAVLIAFGWTFYFPSSILDEIPAVVLMSSTKLCLIKYKSCSPIDAQCDGGVFIHWCSFNSLWMIPFICPVVSKMRFQLWAWCLPPSCVWSSISLVAPMMCNVMVVFLFVGVVLIAFGWSPLFAQ